MSLLLRTERISDDIIYTMVCDSENHFQVSISIYNREYENITNSPLGAERWIQQLVADNIRPPDDEINWIETNHKARNVCGCQV